MTQGARPAEDRLVWARGTVQSRRVVYGAAGSGAPVLFLHGWALGHHAYKRALSRLARRRCRVVAPALPGFGGTADLPVEHRTITGYADWVADFMDELGVDGPAIVIGHSFGGGVAIALAHDHPERVCQLVLVNSVGGGRGSGGGGDLVDRRLWEWGRQFARELRPSERTVRVMIDMREDFVPNLLRNPRALWDVGGLARRADLRSELDELRGRALPVVVVSGRDDTVIPLPAFEALCGALGIEGTLLPGNHMWLLADPDAFDEVMANVLEPRRDDVMTATDELRTPLAATTLPGELADQLIARAPPLWLASDGVSALAADLALCHPAIGAREVRARVSTSAVGWRLTVVAPDRPGLLADTAAALAAEGFSIASASVASWESPDLALHAVTVLGRPPPETVLDHIGARLRSTAASTHAAPEFVPIGRASVAHSGNANGDPILTLTAPDQPGLLWALCRWLADHEASIEAAWMSGGHDDQVKDVFVVRGEVDVGALERHLSAAAPSLSPCTRGRRLLGAPVAEARAVLGKP